MNIRKFLKLSLIIALLVVFVGCNGDSSTTTTTETITTQSTTESSTTATTLQSIELPNLENKTRTEANTILRGLGVNFNLVYETNTSVTENTFLRYDNDLQAGDEVTQDTLVLVVIATEDLVLPDLTGMGQLDMIAALQSRGISYTFDIETNNEVEDQTFSRYDLGFEAGDKISPSFQITVIIGFNTEKLPDLTNMLKGEIEDVLEDLGILFEFSYVVNDDFPEDSFKAYTDFEIGDFYPEEAVEIELYQNTFTDAEYSLLISKYYDGEDGLDNQAIELYNPTDASIDLSDYSLVIYSMGSYDIDYQIELPEIDLGSNETYVIVNSNADSEGLLALADLTSTDLMFDGNDTIQIAYKNGTYIDTIYSINNRDSMFSDELFIRNEEVLSGTRDFNIFEWTAYVNTFIDPIGTHPYDISDKITFEYTTRNFDDPLGGMDLVTLDYISDGDTAAFLPGFTGEERVRFLGVNTPETYPVEDPWGPEAKVYTTTILTYAKTNGKSIYIQSDANLSYNDTYGRHLGLVWVDLGEDVINIDIVDSSDNLIYTETLTGVILLNYHLVKNGFSYNYYSTDSELVFDNRYLYRWFQDAEKFAKENNLGVHE
jgi:beta-lactam-binding protein with PASTA domain/endonuclease YncB( thermonuclease family)